MPEEPQRGKVKIKPVYLALCVPMARKEVLGLWIEETKENKFWPKVFNGGLNNILIAVVDGLRGFPGQLKRSVLRSRSKPAL